jgi:hypothetical protein
MSQPQPPQDPRHLLDTPQKVVAILAGLATIVGVYLTWKSAVSPDTPPPETSVTNTTPNQTTSTFSTTKQDYVRNADQLCSEAFQDAGKVVEEVTNPIDRFEQIILVHQGLYIRWAQLAPPPSDVSKVDRILQTYSRANDHASDAATAYRRGDNPGYYAAEAAGKRLEKQASELAKAYGFRVCNQLGS